MTTKSVFHFLLAAPLLALASCAPSPSVNTVERAQPTFQADAVRDRRIITDPDLYSVATVLEVRQATVQDDLLKIDVELRNTTNSPADIDYKFEWQDGQGMPVEGPTPAWISKHLQAMETVSIVQTAPNPQCKDFRLKIQRSLRY